MQSFACYMANLVPLKQSNNNFMLPSLRPSCAVQQTMRVEHTMQIRFLFAPAFVRRCTFLPADKASSCAGHDIRQAAAKL